MKRRWFILWWLGIFWMLFLYASLGDAATYTVSPTGSDTAAGTATQPWKTVAKAALEATKPGDVVNVLPGTYPEPVVVHGAGTMAKPITFHATVAGAAIITGHVIPAAWPGDDITTGTMVNPWITWRGFAFRNRASLFQLRASQGWTVDTCSFRGGNNGVNVRGTRGVTIISSQFSELSAHAWVIYGCSGCKVVNSTWQHINLFGTSDPANSAVTKAGFTDGLVIEGNTAKYNMGPGIWLDYKNMKYRVARNTVSYQRGRTYAWEGAGIQVELSDGPGVIEGNTVQGNSGSGITLLESHHVTVTGNRVDGGAGCIGLRNMARGAAYGIREAVITGNTLGPCSVGVGTSLGLWDAITGLVINGNDYTRQVGPVMRWAGKTFATRAEVCTGLGFECE